MSPLLALFLATAALAADDDADDKPVAFVPSNKDPFTTWGELRLIGAQPPDLVLNSDGQMLGQDFHLDSRLRVGLAAGSPVWRFSTEWDLFEGQLAGDTWDIPTDEDRRERDAMGVLRQGSFDARRLAVNGRLGPIGIEAGLVTSHWGLGMVANDGAHDPTFGRNDFGDRVIRLRLGSRPFGGGKVPLIVAVAADRVIEDEIGEWTPLGAETPEDRGQDAWQVIGSVLWNDVAKEQKAGLYGVWRYQTEADGERVTNAAVLDGYWDWRFVSGETEVRAAIEAATILGHTSRAQTYTSRDGVKVRSGGITGLIEVDNDQVPVEGLLRGGWASGDGNADDGTLHDFGYDRDFDVGMVMFDEVQGAIDAATWTQLNDSSHSGSPPEGVDALVTEGAASHMLFVQPVLISEPVDWLELKLGWLAAWSTRPVSQPFSTYRNGGNPANHLGNPTSGYKLGGELDWSVKVGDEPLSAAKLRPALLVQGGHYFASEDMGGGTHSLIMATGQLRW